MNPMLVALLALAAPLTQEASKDPTFEIAFTGQTLRCDVFHFGRADAESFAFDQARLEGPWPGSRTQLVDGSGMGKYRFLVNDDASKATLYSRGYCSIYGEWETTGEAKQRSRVFHESLRFPEPRKPVRLIIEKHEADGSFKPVFETRIDPADRFTNRSALTPRGTVTVLQEKGGPSAKVDLLVLADGYTAAQASKFQEDAKRLLAVMFATEPFAKHADDFNIRALHVPSAEAGISDPRGGVWRDAPLGTSFNAFDTDRYVLTGENRALREIAAQAPYDALIILFNGKKYGGGGIYNLWATCASDTGPAAYVFVHEFGHSFAGLADEYYSSQVAYESFTPPGTEPWEPNVTALLDKAKLKWRDFVEPGTPIPTPWVKEAYDKADLENQAKRKALAESKASEEAMDAFYREVRESSGKLLGSDPHFGKAGAFEGAAYEARGLYRPEVDCIMFTRSPAFCRVCRAAIEQAIAAQTR